jgi:hypothetical protein
MSLDPEKRIEKLLRECAEERRTRAGDSWEVHPAIRRVWQQEVAQRFKDRHEPEESAVLWWLNHKWFKPIGVAVGMAVMLIAGWVLFQVFSTSNKVPLLADNRQVQTPTKPDSPALAVQVAAPEIVKAEDKSQNTKELLADNVLAPAPAGIAVSEPQLANSPKDAGSATEARSLNEAQNSFVHSDTKSLSGSGSPASASPALEPSGAGRGLPLASPSTSRAAVAGTPPALAQAETARESHLSSSLSGVRNEPQSSNLAGLPLASSESNVLSYGYFSSLDQPTLGKQGSVRLSRRDSAGTKKTSQILSLFRIEQNGQELRVIDSDDSVYSGPIQDTTSTSAMKSLSQASGAAVPIPANSHLASADGGPQQAVSQQRGLVQAFQVIGTNRSSNQRVVFSGTLSGNTNFVDEIRNNVIAGRAFQASITNQNLDSLRLIGNAVIGAGQAIPIEAWPTLQQQTPRQIK